MKQLALCLAPGLLLALSATAATPAPPKGNAQDGATKAAVCAACHGADGNSLSPEWPKMAGQNEAYIARQLALFKNGTRDNVVMLGFAAALSEQDMHDLGAYYATLKVSPGVADESPITEAGPWEGMPAFRLGERIYRGGLPDRGIPACMACHGPSGLGIPGTAYPSLGGQHADYTKRTLQWFREGNGFAPDQNGQIMKDVAARMTDTEIEAVSTYLEGLAPR